MTDAQTEARAILRKVLAAHRKGNSASAPIAAALSSLRQEIAAKDAELEQYLTDRDAELSASFDAGHYRAMSEHATPWRIRAERAEAQAAELAEAASALWRIPPNMHTIPREANGFAEPDPFEGVGETYADAYTREKSRAERAEAELAELRQELGETRLVLEQTERNAERIIKMRDAQLDEARKALGLMLREHDILSGNFGDVVDPKHRSPDRWPTAAEAARRALEAQGGENG